MDIKTDSSVYAIKCEEVFAECRQHKKCKCASIFVYTVSELRVLFKRKKEKERVGKNTFESN